MPTATVYRQRKDWAFTLRSHTASSRFAMVVRITMDEDVKRCVFRCDPDAETESEVIRGYIMFKTPKRTSFVKHFIPGAIWERPLKGGVRRNVALIARGDQSYDEFIEFGVSGHAYGVNHDYYEFDSTGDYEGNVDLVRFARGY